MVSFKAFGFLLLSLLLAGCAFAGENTSDIKWHKIEQLGVTIEYQEGMEELAKQLLPEIAKRIETNPLTTDSTALRKVVKQKRQILNFISHQVGMDEPGPQMTSMFDRIVLGINKLNKSLPDPHHIKLWHKESLKNQLIAGKNIPGIKFDPKANTFTVELKVTFKEDNGSITFPHGYPVMVNDLKSPVSQALDDFDHTFNTFKDTKVGPGELFHEVTEVAMIFDCGIVDPFRRWFCEGVANNITALTLEKFVSREESQAFISLFDPNRYTHLKDQVDLIAWKGCEYQQYRQEGFTDDIEHAGYAFSTYEIQELMKRHGMDVITRVMKGILTVEVRDDQAIYSAIQKVTGEDIKAVLGKYGTMADRSKHRMIGMKNACIGIAEAPNNYNWRCHYKDAPSNSVFQLSRDGKSGICFSFDYANPEPPVKCKIDIYRNQPGNPELVGSYTWTLKDRVGSFEKFWWFPKHLSKPGPYVLVVSFDGQVFTGTTFELVSSVK